jgi:hypothetical protein
VKEKERNYNSAVGTANREQRACRYAADTAATTSAAATAGSHSYAARTRTVMEQLPSASQPAGG